MHFLLVFTFSTFDRNKKKFYIFRVKLDWVHLKTSALNELNLSLPQYANRYQCENSLRFQHKGVNLHSCLKKNMQENGYVISTILVMCPIKQDTVEPLITDTLINEHLQ
jgi:hypothetical protein